MQGLLPLRFPRNTFQYRASRAISSSTKPKAIPRGALLYVPSSSDKFLTSSLKSSASTLTFDLEDSVHVDSKSSARTRLSSFLEFGIPPTTANSPSSSASGRARPLHGLSIAVRANSIHIPDESGEMKEGFGEQDIVEIWGGNGGKRWNDGAGPMMVLPKIDHPSMLTAVDHLIVSLRDKHPHPKTPVIASIESPEALMNIAHIAGWRGRGMELVGLLFAAEDFCASTHILRSSSRIELLHARSSIVIAARAFGLAAVDMVCVDYKDLGILKNESEEGRRLGFDGKQAIHPSQVEIITQSYAPSESEIHRAALILSNMAASSSGAIGMKSRDGKEEMIDRPMVLQAERIIKEARAAGLNIPDVTA